MSYFVSTKNFSGITLNEKDTVKSVLQNIRIILMTRQFSVPLYRNFGLPMQFLDRPMAVARPLLIAEINDAISEYEPRAIVLSVNLETDISTPGKLIPIVEVEIKDA
ncbi:MAG: GPW/gp25 family protein [Sedimentibacter sp.]